MDRAYILAAHLDSAAAGDMAHHNTFAMVLASLRMAMN